MYNVASDKLDLIEVHLRVQPSKRRGVPLGLCGCLAAVMVVVVVLGITAVVLFLNAPSLALVFAGFKPQGSTSQVFIGQATVPPVRPGVISIILDLDLFSTLSSDKPRPDLWRLIDSLHGRVEQIFETCITDEVRRLIE